MKLTFKFIALVFVMLTTMFFIYEVSLYTVDFILHSEHFSDLLVEVVIFLIMAGLTLFVGVSEYMVYKLGLSDIVFNKIMDDEDNE